MKDREDKSMGIVTRITGTLVKIKPTEPLRLTKRAARQKRKFSDFSGNSPAKILASRCASRKAASVCLVQGTVRLRSTGGGHSVCEHSVCALSGTSIAVMSHCDIHHECAREPIVFSAW